MSLLPSKERLGKRSLLAFLLSLCSLFLVLPVASAYPGGPWFVADKPYVGTVQWTQGQNMTIGDLADPDIYYENGIYYAYGTNSGGRNVPLITSTDLKNWKTNSRYTPPATSPDGRKITNAKDWWFNDALAQVGSWAYRDSCDSATQGCVEVWAPAVEKLPTGRYVMAYSAPMANNRSKRCIGIATADKPTGPFFDTSTAPITCPNDPTGGIDPDILRDGNRAYLYWKNEGNGAAVRPAVHVRELDTSTGTRFAAGSVEKTILETNHVNVAGQPRWGETWERPLIENPSMIKYQGKYYLFYSGSGWNSLNYRQGYAVCSGPTGPCQRESHTPILTTDATWGIGGPGGGSAFIDKAGKLRLGYAAWRADRAGYDNFNLCSVSLVRFFENSSACTGNQRFFHVATVEKYGPNGLLAIPKKSEFAWAAASAYPQPRAFTDVSGAAFSSEINWLAASGVSNGWSDNTFRPFETVNRDQMAAFFYRLAGSPEYTPPSHSPFKDVPTSHVFYKEIAWMNSVGISQGWSDGTFRPYQPVNRDQMAIFFYRMAGSPSYTAPGQSAFYDVPTDQVFYKAISWMKQEGISTGWADGSYRPYQPVNRDQMAAFMYRLAQKGPMVAYL